MSNSIRQNRTRDHTLDSLSSGGYTYRCQRSGVRYETPDERAVRCRYCSRWLRTVCRACGSVIPAADNHSGGCRPCAISRQRATGPAKLPGLILGVAAEETGRT